MHDPCHSYNRHNRYNPTFRRNPFSNKALQLQSPAIRGLIVALVAIELFGTIGAVLTNVSKNPNKTIMRTEPVVGIVASVILLRGLLDVPLLGPFGQAVPDAINFGPAE